MLNASAGDEPPRDHQGLGFAGKADLNPPVAPDVSDSEYFDRPRDATDRNHTPVDPGEDLIRTRMPRRRRWGNILHERNRTRREGRTLVSTHGKTQCKVLATVNRSVLRTMRGACAESVNIFLTDVTNMSPSTDDWSLRGKSARSTRIVYFTQPFLTVWLGRMPG